VTVSVSDFAREGPEHTVRRGRDSECGLAMIHTVSVSDFAREGPEHTVRRGCDSECGLAMIHTVYCGHCSIEIPGKLQLVARVMVARSRMCRLFSTGLHRRHAGSSVVVSIFPRSVPSDYNEYQLVSSTT
jgi:hypothetical protein